MKKEVYSLVLSDDVVSAIDRAASVQGTNRSNLINQILAEYVSYVTPEKRMRDIFSYMEEILCSQDTFQLMHQASEAMMSVRSSFAFKYNPNMRYSVELYRDVMPEIGELRVSLRTQSSTLLLYIMQFYKLWAKIERAYVPDCDFLTDGGRYIRKLKLRNLSSEVANETLSCVISDYITLFDSALKTYFYNLDEPEAAAEKVEDIYRGYVKKSGMII